MHFKNTKGKVRTEFIQENAFTLPVGDETNFSMSTTNILGWNKNHKLDIDIEWSILKGKKYIYI